MYQWNWPVLWAAADGGTTWLGTLLHGLRWTLAVGLTAEREDGLAAGITVLAAFTVYFAISLILRPLERKSPRP